MSLISVDQAREIVLADTPLLADEETPLARAGNRVLAKDIAAKRDQPPFPASAMDGYAVRAADVADVPASLKVVGEAPAGRAFAGRVGPGQAVRIFTGAPVPEGADAIAIQENCTRSGDQVQVNKPVEAGTYVRPAGLDFAAGDVLLANHTWLGASELALLAAINVPMVPVRRRPIVAIIATGDELVLPGEDPADDQIIASNNYGIAETVRQAGGVAVDLGVVGDTEDELDAAVDAAVGSAADILVTSGGASVGDHDLVKSTLEARGMEVGFWTIAMRPGKPMMFGRLNGMKMLGFPGNPVSSMVASHVFLKPLIRRYLGLSDQLDIRTGICGADIGPNDQREEFMRATAAPNAQGQMCVTPFSRQDSSMLRTFQVANALLIRPGHDPGIKAGVPIRYIPLNHLA